MKKLREKEESRRAENSGLIGCGGLDISTFEVSLGEIGIKMKLRWKWKEPVHTVKKLG